MAREQKIARVGLAAGVVLASASVLGFSGCIAHGARRFEAPTVERRQASREQLLTLLKQQMDSLATLVSDATVSIVVQDVVVPATMADDVARMRGKPYGKRFLQTEVDGQLFLYRDPDGTRNIRFSGVIGHTESFMLLGKNHSFWMLLPTSEEERAQLMAQGQAPPRGKVLTGTLEPQAVRPQGVFSMRPQDIADLLLLDEVYVALRSADVCYIETWPDFYVMNFLRHDWPEQIYSKVWIERHGLTVAIHQLFDGSGEIVAEGRFRNYGHYAAKGSKVMAEIPTDIEFLWPRDKVVLRATLTGPKVNERILPRFFDEKVLEGYPTEPLQSPAAPPR